MVRSDHSFRSPMPEATINFDSTNACNICHSDKSPEWANRIVKARANRKYQKETLEWAQLIKNGREGDWGQLDKMLSLIEENQLNEVVLTAILRLLINCDDERKWNQILNSLQNKSPMVRAAAAASLIGNTSQKVKNALVQICDDEYRIVPVSAATSLSGFSSEQFTVYEFEQVLKVIDKYIISLVSRPDDWSSHYNLGFFYQNQGYIEKALESYETAANLYPEAIMPLINSSVLYSVFGNTDKAELNLKQVIEFDPENEAANLNLGFLLAEQGKMDEAEHALRTALTANPKLAVAAYNLSVILSGKNRDEAIHFAEIAVNEAPDDYRYKYILGYYLAENNQYDEAILVLKNIIHENPSYISGVKLLAELYIKNDNFQEALNLFQNTLKVSGISDQDRIAIQQVISSIKQQM
jgi:tetratricopeptide (TPR) repeat protein